jgi:hypothetical protein
MTNGHIGIATVANCIPTSDANATNVAKAKPLNGVQCGNTTV